MFDLEDQLDHPSLDGLPGDNTENDLTIFLGSLIQATDFDGDTVPGGAVQIVVNDDTPIAVAGTSTDSVDEDALPNGIDGGPGDIGLGVDAVATGSVTGLFQSGADVPLTYGFNTAGCDAAAGADVGRRCAELRDRCEHDHGVGRGGQHGVHDRAGRVDGSMDVHAGQAARPCADGQTTENDLTINFGGMVQATDRDGDTVTAIGTAVSVTGRRRHADCGCRDVDGRVDEDALPNGIDGGPGDIGLGVDAVATGLGGGAVPVGRGRAADLWVHRLRLRLAGAGLTSGGVALSYAIAATRITAEAGRATRCSRSR